MRHHYTTVDSYQTAGVALDTRPGVKPVNVYNPLLCARDGLTNVDGVGSRREERSRDCHGWFLGEMCPVHWIEAKPLTHSKSVSNLP